MRSVALALVATLALAVPARAQPGLGGARRAYEEAEFRTALELLERAEASQPMNRADYVRLLELRVLVLRALGDTEALTATLRAMASIAPRHDFGREAPPDVTERFAQVRSALPGALLVEGQAVRGDGGVIVRARVRNDVAGVVRALRIVTRTDGAWEVRDGDELRVPADPDTPVHWYVEAIGPGDAVLARVGSAASPRTVLPAAAVGAPAEAAEEDDGGGSPWPWIGAGAGVVAVAIVLAVLLAGGEDETQLHLSLGD